jgi:hypothetical protein
MIERYTTPEMRDLWSEEGKFRAWLEVEIAICEGLAHYGYIPADAPAIIRERARFDLARIAELEQETRHDVMAFVRNLAENVGEAGRWIHYGVTSYDVVDTALAVRLKRSVELILAECDALHAEIRRLALEHLHTPMIGRTHGVHAEPITFGFKLLGWYAELERHRQRLERLLPEISVGKVSGAVGIHANVDPRVEEYVCAKLGLTPDPASTQIVARDRHASLLCALAVLAASLEKFATEIRNLQRTEILEVQEPFAPGANWLLRDAAQAQPVELRDNQRAGAHRAGKRARNARKRRHLARARPNQLQRGAHCHPRQLHARPLDAAQVHKHPAGAGGAARQHASQSGAARRATLQRACDARADSQGSFARARLQTGTAQRCARVGRAHPVPGRAAWRPRSAPVSE